MIKTGREEKVRVLSSTCNKCGDFLLVSQDDNESFFHSFYLDFGIVTYYKSICYKCIVEIVEDYLKKQITRERRKHGTT